MRNRNGGNSSLVRKKLGGTRKRLDAQVFAPFNMLARLKIRSEKLFGLIHVRICMVSWNVSFIYYESNEATRQVTAESHRVSLSKLTALSFHSTARSAIAEKSTAHIIDCNPFRNRRFSTKTNTFSSPFRYTPIRLSLPPVHDQAALTIYNV